LRDEAALEGGLENGLLKSGDVARFRIKRRQGICGSGPRIRHQPQYLRYLAQGRQTESTFPIPCRHSRPVDFRPDFRGAT